VCLTDEADVAEPQVAEAAVTSFDEALDVPPPKSPRSTSATTSPWAAAAGSPRYDGLKSSYPQLHQLGVAAAVPDADLKSSYAALHDIGAAAVPDSDLKSSYPQMHAVLSGAVRLPAVGASGSAIDWRDATLGGLVGAAAAGLLAAAVVLRFRRRLPALH
jgi:hypothetical protein